MSKNRKIDNGRIILINGTSSAGKTAVIKEFQLLQPEYTVFKMDDYWPEELAEKAACFGWSKKSSVDPWLFLLKYASTIKSKPVLTSTMRSLLFDEIPSYYSLVKEKVEQGHNVIIDTVFEFEKEYDIFYNYFKDYTVFSVLIYCPLDVLLKRVGERNKIGDESEKRHAFGAFEQFPAIYKINDNPKEYIIDTIESIRMIKALNQAIQELIDQKISDEYLTVIDEFKHNFVKQFRLNEQKNISLSARHYYNSIFSSNKNSPLQLAHKLESKINHI